MKAYIVQSQRRVEPFGDHPRDCLIGNQPLAQHQEETLRALDLEPAAIPDASQIGDTGEHVVLRDTHSSRGNCYRSSCPGPVNCESPRSAA